MLILYKIEVQNEDKLMQANEEHIVNLRKNSLGADLRSIVSDLLYLSKEVQMSRVLQNGELADTLSLAEEWTYFSKQKMLYDQIRLLDPNGMEVLRVNYNNGNPAITPQSQLQPKGHRFYFQETFLLKRGRCISLHLT